MLSKVSKGKFLLKLLQTVSNYENIVYKCLMKTACNMTIKKGTSKKYFTVDAFTNVNPNL